MEKKPKTFNILKKKKIVEKDIIILLSALDIFNLSFLS